MRSPHNILIAFLLLAAACGPSKERTALNSLRTALDSSTSTLKDGIDQTFLCMKSMTDDPFSYPRAIIWMPKVQHLRDAADSCIAILDSIAIGQAKAPSALVEKLDVYYQALQSITTGIPFNRVSITELSDHLSDTLLQRILISRIRNEILRTGYALMQYSLRQLEHPKMCTYYFPELMINTTHPRRGDTVCIKAWYGMVMSDLNLTLTTSDTTIPQGTNEGIEYKFAATDPPGPHPLRVQMSYPNPDGTTAIIERTFTYTITR